MISDLTIRGFALLCAFAVSATAFHSASAGAAKPKAIAITSAAIAGGRLAIVGKASKAGAQVSIAGTAFKTTSKPDGSFALSVLYRPPTCSLQILSAGHAVSAKVAGCVRPGSRGPSGDAGSAGAAGTVGPQGPTGPVGPTGAAGSQGAIGVSGALGPQGSQGPTGPGGSPLMSAVVGFHGELVRGSYVTSVTKSISGDAFYDVLFDRPVNLCAYVVTVGGTGSVGAIGQASAAGFSPNPNLVRVYVFKPGTSTVEGQPFHLIVACP